MKSHLFPIVCAAAGCGILVGCANVPKDAGFKEVQQLTTDRTGLVVQWDSRTTDDQSVAAKVREMLAHDLTADKAAQIALLNNHHLQATFEDLGIAQADLVQAGLLKNPVFDLGVRFPDRSPAATYLDIAVAEDFLDIALLPARKKLAAGEFEAAKARVSDEVLTLVAQTQSDFYAYQAAQQMADLRRTITQSTAASLEITKKLHDAGNVTDMEFATERAQNTRAKIDLAEAEATAAQAREKITEQMGLWGTDIHWKAAPRLADIPSHDPQPDQLESLAIRQRQDLAAAREEVIVQARTLGLTADYRFASEINLGPEFEHETDGQWRIGPTLSVPIPLFDQGQAKVSRAEAMLRQSRQRYLAMEVDVRSEVRMALSRLSIARNKALLYHDEVLPTQHDVLQQTQLEYNGMYTGVFQLLAVRRDQIDADSEYIASLRDYWMARTDLRRAVGGRLPENDSSPTTKNSIDGETP
jgi:outer membrane protein, heavy metal efflux system